MILAPWMACGWLALLLEYLRYRRYRHVADYPEIQRLMWDLIERGELRALALCLAVCSVGGPLLLLADLAVWTYGHALDGLAKVAQWWLRRHPRNLATHYAGGAIEWRCHDCGATATVGRDSFFGKVPYCFDCLGANHDLWPDRRITDGVRQMEELASRAVKVQPTEPAYNWGDYGA